MMKITIRGDKLEVTVAIKDYIKNKLSKLDKYFDKPEEIDCHALIKAKNNEQTIEITIPTNRFSLRAEEKHNDLYAAIDLIVDKLERMIRKNKTRLEKHYHNIEVVDFNFNYEEEKDEESKIVKRKNVDSKPMNEEEAILQMELSDHDFFAFKNTDEECVSVLYTRKDGKYGIINIK